MKGSTLRRLNGRMLLLVLWDSGISKWTSLIILASRCHQLNWSSSIQYSARSSWGLWVWFPPVEDPGSNLCSCCPRQPYPDRNCTRWWFNFPRFLSYKSDTFGFCRWIHLPLVELSRFFSKTSKRCLLHLPWCWAQWASSWLWCIRPLWKPFGERLLLIGPPCFSMDNATPAKSLCLLAITAAIVLDVLHRHILRG